MTSCLSKCQNSPEPTNSPEPSRCAVVSGSEMLSADTVASMDQNCLSSTPLIFLLRLRSEKFNSSQANTSTLLLYSSIPEPFLPRCRAHYAAERKGCSWSATKLRSVGRVKVKWMAASASSLSPHCASWLPCVPAPYHPRSIKGLQTRPSEEHLLSLLHIPTSTLFCVTLRVS